MSDADTTADAMIENPPEEDNRLIVRVDLANAPDGEKVEIPGLGLFENHVERRVDEVQVALYNAQPFDRKIDPQQEVFIITIPPPVEGPPSEGLTDTEGHEDDEPGETNPDPVGTGDQGTTNPQED